VSTAVHHGRSEPRAPAIVAGALLTALAIGAAQRTRPADAVGAPIAGERWVVDLNTASVVELALLPGVGPSISQRIVDSRRDDGRFDRVDELERVRGIGPVTLERIRPWASVAASSPFTPNSPGTPERP